MAVSASPPSRLGRTAATDTVAGAAGGVVSVLLGVFPTPEIEFSDA